MVIDTAMAIERAMTINETMVIDVSVVMDGVGATRRVGGWGKWWRGNE